MKKYVLKHKAWLSITVLARSLGALLQVFVAIILQRIVNTAVSGNMNDFVKISLFSVFYFFVMSVMDYSTGTSQAVYLKKTISDLREDIFKGIFSKDYKEFNSNNTADYISNLTNDINLVENNYIIPMLMMIGDIVIFLGTVIVLLSINVWITLTLFITAGFMLIVPGTLSKPMKNVQNKLSNKLGDFTTNIKEMFLGYEVIKSHNVEKNIINEFGEKNIELAKCQFKSNHIQAITGSISVFLAIFCQATGLIVGGFFLIKGNLTVGSLVAIIQLGTGINGPIMWITQKITQIKGMKGVNEKLIAITKLKSEHSKNLEELNVFNDKIEINNLAFSYQEGNNILNGINYTFEKNKKYAIVGESGCGKSTLIKLMLGYYKDYEGNITIDSKEVKNIKSKSISQLISMIHQNVYMFDKSIKDNILLGEKYSENQVESTIESSGIDKFIGMLPKGIDSLIGENGCNISGGQKQRVAIARALIRNTPILILDEGTSALDLKTAWDIEEKLLSQEDLTIITVTHKLNKELLSKYDEIIVMDKGKIIKQGSYNNLTTKGNEFLELLLNN